MSKSTEYTIGCKNCGVYHHSFGNIHSLCGYGCHIEREKTKNDYLIEELDEKGRHY